jgi:photosystem II stability/assembly factor-like uncharacterized protein
MDPLERELRDLLTSDRHNLPASLVALDRVHAGASRRRRRRATVASAATAVVVLAVAGTAAGTGFLRGDETPAADSSPTVSRGIATAPEPTSTAPATAIAPAGPAWDGARVISVTATSTRTFVVLGELGDTGACTPPDCVRLAETHDGGRTFAALPVPDDARGAVDPASADSATGVRFGSAQDGWLFGGGLWSTHDGGHTWARVATPGRVARLEAAAGTAWALVPTRDDAMTLWRTPVGTDDWTQVTDVSVTGPADLAVHGDRVVVVGAQDAQSWAGGPGGFAKHASPCAGSLQAELSAVGSFWVKCETGTLARLAVSPDGATWSDVVIDSRNGAVPNSAALGARTDTEALVGQGVDPPLARVFTDSKLIALASLPSGQQASYVGFTTPSIGYTILGTDLWRTDDGGDTWARMQIS